MAGMTARLSLNLRLVLAASAVLAAFLGLTGVALEQAFARSSLALIEERLLAQVYGLLSAANMDDKRGLYLDESLPDPRFSMPESGLYADVVDAAGRSVWQSPNTMGRVLSFPEPVEPGHPSFGPTRTEDGHPMLAISFGVEWERSDASLSAYVFRVAVPEASYEERLRRFRRSLWGWLGGATAGLLLAQALVLRWSLAPLRRITREVQSVERGQRERLSGEWPEELRPLATNLNHLIAVGQRQIERYRNALGDLAHSLKTPLAVVRNAAGQTQDEHPNQLSDFVLEQVDRMDRSVEYHLHRAAASGRAVFGPPVELAPLLVRMRDTLLKVHASKRIELRTTVHEDCVFRGDENDLTEVLGNLMDNACKWAAATVAVTLHRVDTDDPGLKIDVEDDGPGIPGDKAADILARGTRLDEATPGHGIGLAVVKDIIENAYGGELLLSDSSLGGLRVTAILPLEIGSGDVTSA